MPGDKPVLNKRSCLSIHSLLSGEWQRPSWRRKGIRWAPARSYNFTGGLCVCINHFSFFLLCSRWLQNCLDERSFSRTLLSSCSLLLPSPKVMHPMGLRMQIQLDSAELFGGPSRKRLPTLKASRKPIKLGVTETSPLACFLSRFQIGFRSGNRERIQGPTCGKHAVVRH